MAKKTEKPLAGRLALVTGASRGIGRAAAFALACAGAHVIAAARTQGGLEELDDEIRASTGESATLTPFDLVDGGAIDRLGGAVFERWKKLDILFHAGAMLGGLSPLSHFDPKDWAKVMAVNSTATYRLIRSFEPLLKQSDAARAIFVTTGRARQPRAFWGPYAASKAAVEAMVLCWADEIENTSVTPVLLDPGRMRTRMRGEAFPGEDPAALPPPEDIGPLAVELCRADRRPHQRVSFVAWREGAPVSDPV